MINLMAVGSSNVSKIGYNSDNGDLFVLFRSGHLYVYHGVVKEKYDTMLTTDSIGRYLNLEIKPHHTFDRLPDSFECLVD